MEAKINKQIGKKIELCRKLRNRSREWLGKKLGISYHQIYKYETGRNRVAASTLFRVSVILNYPIKHFFDKKNGDLLNY